MAVTQHDEVERKFEVDPGIALPPLAGIGEVATEGQSQAIGLKAVYFDTERFDLHVHGITLRRRTGGSDPGWHLKLPGKGDHRTELHADLGKSDTRVPARLIDPVRALVRDRPLGAVASVDTRRSQRELIDDQGLVLALLCDDLVTGRRLDRDDEVQTWREVEVELVEGPVQLLDTVGSALEKVGATAPRASSKVRRVLQDAGSADGSRDPSRGRDRRRSGRARRRGGRRQPKEATSREDLLTYLEAHIAELHLADRDVRTGTEGGVHRLRIAARQLRAVLTTYASLLPQGSVTELRNQLRWLGQTLAEPRDAQVLLDRLETLLGEQPRALVVGPVHTRVTRELSARRRTGNAAVRTAMRSATYYQLLDSLDALVVYERWTPIADRPARVVAPKLLRKDLRDLHRAVAQTPDAGSDRGAALHEVRKKAKKLRYAAESAVPALGPRAAKLAKRAKRIQTTLGEHQDAVMAAQALRRCAAQADADGDSSFTFGRLHALEVARAADAEAACTQALGKLPQNHLRQWLKK